MPVRAVDFLSEPLSLRLMQYNVVDIVIVITIRRIGAVSVMC
jgi:hypothetical protein